MIVVGLLMLAATAFGFGWVVGAAMARADAVEQSLGNVGVWMGHVNAELQQIIRAQIEQAKREDARMVGPTQGRISSN